MAKILFVEDEPDIRDLVRMALEDEHGVTLAETAEEGLRRAAEGELLLSDVASRLRDTLEEIGVEPTDGEDSVR